MTLNNKSNNNNNNSHNDNIVNNKNSTGEKTQNPANVVGRQGSRMGSRKSKEKKV